MFPNAGEFIVVNVESRKGGVGKTTCALGFANLLVEDGFEVLFLDLDLTGTESASWYDSVKCNYFFGNHLNLVTKNSSTDKKDAYNLIDMFEEFIEGNEPDNIAFVNKNGNSATNAIMLNPKQVNIFSSNLVRSKTGKNEYRYSPAVLSDEMHSTWFVEMIKVLVNATCRNLPKKENGGVSRLVVVIDNSPGYTALSQALENWITDIGPECGKYLFISTINEQDYKSIFESIDAVHQHYKEKKDASREYKDAISNLSYAPGPMNLRQQQFFTRLATESPSRTNNCCYPSKRNVLCVNCGLCYYRDSTCCGTDTLSNLHTGLIFNIVPKKVSEIDAKDIFGEIKESDVSSLIRSSLNNMVFEELLTRHLFYGVPLINRIQSITLDNLNFLYQGLSDSQINYFDFMLFIFEFKTEFNKLKENLQSKQTPEELLHFEFEKLKLEQRIFTDINENYNYSNSIGRFSYVHSFITFGNAILKALNLEQIETASDTNFLSLIESVRNQCASYHLVILDTINSELPEKLIIKTSLIYTSVPMLVSISLALVANSDNAIGDDEIKNISSIIMSLVNIYTDKLFSHEFSEARGFSLGTSLELWELPLIHSTIVDKVIDCFIEKHPEKLSATLNKESLAGILKSFCVLAARSFNLPDDFVFCVTSFYLLTEKSLPEEFSYEIFKSLDERVFKHVVPRENYLRMLENLDEMGLRDAKTIYDTRPELRLVIYKLSDSQYFYSNFVDVMNEIYVKQWSRFSNGD